MYGKYVHWQIYTYGTTSALTGGDQKAISSWPHSILLIQSSTFHSSPDQDLSRPTTSFDLTATDIKSHKLFFSALLLRSYHLDQHTKKWRHNTPRTNRLSPFFLGLGSPLHLPPTLHLLGLGLAPRTWPRSQRKSASAHSHSYHQWW